MRFHQRVLERIQTSGNHVCVGIDPHVQNLPVFLASELKRLGGQEFLLKLSRSILDGAEGAAAIKFQSAFFEAYGSPGFRVLEEALRDAKHLGFLTVLDAKRGDISSTMNAYGVAAFDQMKADALTVTAYMGTDVVDALTPWGERGHGAYVVWISSNPSGREVQETAVVVGDANEELTVADKLQKDIDVWEAKSNLVGMTGYVLGATKLDKKIVSKLNQAQRFFLIPGVGAQGGKVDATLTGILEYHPGTLVAMSRSLTGLGIDDGEEWSDISSWTDYVEAVSLRCRAAILDLKKS